ncbi:MAG: hypothetical protein K6A38_05180 [Lachnospiraceae bacterium]|nr:hypothetical protein [Lachnospiraceae bacterium]
MIRYIIKRLLVSLTTLSLVASLSGCGNLLQTYLPSNTAPNEGEYVTDNATQVVSPDELESHESVPENVTDDTASSQEGLFYYDHLSSDDKKIYIEIYYILNSMMEEVTVSTLDEEQLSRVFECVINDHPELFYVDGYSYVKYMVGQKPKEMTFSGTYNMTKDEANEHVKRINEYIDTFAESLKNGVDNTDDYNIIKFVYEYIIRGTDYDKNVKFDQSIVSVMEEGRSVCSGYSKTAQLLLNSCGISTTVVLGRVKDGEAHSWNLVLADGKYYYMDVTWGDSSYTLREDSDEFSNSLPEVNYIYMLMPLSEIEDTHDFDHPEYMPECLSMEDNYFVKEKLYFTAVDDQMLWQAFNNAYVNEKEYIMIRMDNPECYDNMRDHLLKDQKIFDYVLTRDGSVSYAENREQRYMVFWL